MKMDGGFLAVAITTDTVANTFVATSKDALTADAWNHVCYTVDTSSKAIKIFVNGILSSVSELPLLLWCPNIINETTTQTFETAHPYSDDMREYWHVKVPNAFKYVVIFDKQSVTEDGCDYVRFYKGTSRSQVIGDDKYTGRKFAGVNSVPPLVVEDNEFDIFFYSDGSRTDWGFRAYVTATCKKAGEGGGEIHNDVNKHPFFIGQAPGYATTERAATCAISQVFVVKQTANVDEIREIACSTSHYSTLPTKLEYLEDLTIARCPAESVLPLNAYAHLPAVKSVFTAVLKESGPENDYVGFSIGLILKSSISMRGKDDFVLVGKDAVSYGVYFNGLDFELGYSRNPKRRRSSIHTGPAAAIGGSSTISIRQLSVGDIISIVTDLKASTLEISVTGSAVNVSKTFGLPVDVKDPASYILAASLASGQAIHLSESTVGNGFAGQSPVEDEDDEEAAIPLGPIVVGSRVRVKAVPVEVAESTMSSGSGGWASSMATCLGKFGKVTDATSSGIWRVQMENSSDSYVWQEELLEMVVPPKAVSSGSRTHPGCAARRPNQVGTNTCRSCGGRYKTCFGEYGHRDSSGTWTGGPCPDDLSEYPESPNDSWCTLLCEQSVRAAPVSGGCDSSCTLSHSSDGDCLVCGRPWGPHNGHNCSGGARGSWRVGGAAGSAATAAAGGGGGSTGTVVNGSKVVLTADYAAYADATDGPLHPGDVGTVIKDDSSSKPFKVEFNGKTWWYERGALALYSPTEAVPQRSAEVSITKKRGAVLHFDIGFGVMDLPMTASTIGSLDTAESLGIIGAVCRVSYMSLKSQGPTGMQRLLSHDILSPFVRLSFMADSISIRTAATKSVSLLLPFSSPAAALTSLKTVFPDATSFVEFLLISIGSKLSGSTASLDVSPLAFTEIYQLLDILTSLFSRKSEWSRELEKVLSRCIDTSSVALSTAQQCQDVKTLLGLLTLFQNEQRLAKVSPGNVISVKESANSIIEKYIVLTYSKEGKFEDFFDVSPERSIENHLSLVRVHKSSIVNCSARVSLDDEFSSVGNSAQTLSKATLFCLQKMPSDILKLLMNISSVSGDMESRYEILYIKAIALDILSAFVAHYSAGNYIDPSPEVDSAFYSICNQWPTLVHSVAECGIASNSPLNTRQPESIESESLLLMQMLMNGVGEEGPCTAELKLNASTTTSTVNTLVTILSEIVQGYTYAAVPVSIFTADTKVSEGFMKSFKSKSDTSIAMPNNSSDAAVIAKKAPTQKEHTTTAVSKVKCIRGHSMVKYTGTKIAGVPATNVVCFSCSLPGIETDSEKFYFCKACTSCYCALCTRGLNGQVLCANFK